LISGKQCQSDKASNAICRHVLYLFTLHCAQKN